MRASSTAMPASARLLQFPRGCSPTSLAWLQRELAVLVLVVGIAGGHRAGRTDLDITKLSWSSTL